MGRVRAVLRSPSVGVGLAATEELVDEATLLPEERDLIEGATPERSAEFATGRHCARLALASLEPPLSRTPLLRDHQGAPTWPTGVVGSITHCRGWTGAVVARSRGSRLGRGVAAIGLDAEPIAPLPPGVLEVAASGREREVLARLSAERPGLPWDTLLFSAKEATYKAWYPLTGILLDHAAVEVELSPSGAFTGRAAAHDPAGRELRRRVGGRWVLGPRVLVTLCVAG